MRDERGVRSPIQAQDVPCRYNEDDGLGQRCVYGRLHHPRVLFSTATTVSLEDPGTYCFRSLLEFTCRSVPSHRMDILGFTLH